jgi:UDP-N-acetylmuramoylalanine--D-glutamate ligase
MAVNLKQFQNKNIHIVGISGMEGLAVWRFFKKHEIKITLHDFSENLEALKQSFFSFHDYLSESEKNKIWRDLESEKANICLKEDYLKGINESDIIFVPQSWFRYPANKPLQELKGKVKFKQLTELYFENFTGTIIGVTGSSGKSTTANLIYHLIYGLRGKNVWLSGNDRHNPPVLLEIEKANKNDLLILEISNRQLIDLKYSPQIAVVTTLASTHLDDHKTFENYLAAKENIVRYQTANDLAILNYDNQYVRDFANKTKAEVQWFGLNSGIGLSGAFLIDEKLSFIFKQTQNLLAVENLPLPGVHNVLNALAASLVARFLGVSNRVISQNLLQFKGLEHRLELIAEFKGTKFYNDTQATNPEAAKAAIEAFPQKEKIVIAGGKKKDNPADFKPWLKSLFKNKVKVLLLIGEAEDQIVAELKKINSKTRPNFGSGRIPFLVKKCQNMEAAVKEAFVQTKSDGIVLMSPACESFGEFTDYRERGEKFKTEVEKQIRNLFIIQN